MALKQVEDAYNAKSADDPGAAHPVAKPTKSEKTPSAEDIVGIAAREFEVARSAYDNLSQKPIDGDLEARVKARTTLGMAEARYRRAGRALQEAIALVANQD